jgi:ElaB/YqjD/DUF883 family membrane-anchored ribosome-binding protein
MERMTGNRTPKDNNLDDVTREAVATARAAIDEQVEQLLADVQELLRRIGSAADPEMARVRAKVESAVSATKAAIADRASQVQHQARRAVTAGNDYVRGQPWSAVGVAAAAALFVGFLIARR